MSPHLRSALWAGTITLILAFVPAVVMETRTSGRWLEDLLTAPAVPAFHLATYWGLRGGPDGLPHLAYVYGLTFFLLWALFDLVHALWRWTRGG